MQKENRKYSKIKDSDETKGNLDLSNRWEGSKVRAVAGKQAGKKGEQFLVRHKARASPDKEVWEI